jgi:hypothetical protein
MQSSFETIAVSYARIVDIPAPICLYRCTNVEEFYAGSRTYHRTIDTHSNMDSKIQRRPSGNQTRKPRRQTTPCEILEDL